MNFAMQTASNEYGIVLLAAGASNRLGQPKQLLIFENETLVKKMARVALQITEKLVVVTGANSNEVQHELVHLPAHIIHNEFFKDGIASSIKTGLNNLLYHFKEIDSVIFMVCDQPFVSAELVAALIEKREQTGKTIIASHYAGTLGTPVLFQKKFFPDLLRLEGDTGAKKIIYQHPEEVASVDFPPGAVDVDTMDDYELLLLKQKKV